MGETLPRLRKAVLKCAVPVVAERHNGVDVAVSLAALTIQEAAAPRAWRGGKPSAFRSVMPAKSRTSKNADDGYHTREKETH